MGKYSIKVTVDYEFEYEAETEAEAEAEGWKYENYAGFATVYDITVDDVSEEEDD
jgi:hypothetical protein